MKKKTMNRQLLYSRDRHRAEHRVEQGKFFRPAKFFCCKQLFEKYFVVHLIDIATKQVLFLAGTRTIRCKTVRRRTFRSTDNLLHRRFVAMI